MGYEIPFADEIYDCSPAHNKINGIYAAGIGPQPTGFFYAFSIQWNFTVEYNGTLCQILILLSGCKAEAVQV